MSFKSFFFVLGCSAAALLSSCHDGKRYADYLEDEKDAISDYIEENNIKVVSTMPDSTTEWLTPEGNPVYYRFSNGLYFHLIDKGDTTTLPPNVGNLVYLRYKGVNVLNGQTCYDYTPANMANPDVMRVLAAPSANNTFGIGFQKAVRCLYAGGHCKTIIPFKIGNGYNTNVDGIRVSDESVKRPIAYEIWVNRIE